jgi:hypothetical protein
LGPTGKFTECGDATLWFVVRVQNSPATTKAAVTTNRNINDAKQRRRDQLHMGVFGIEEDNNSGDAEAEEEELVWSFQVVDRDFPDSEERSSTRSISALVAVRKTQPTVVLLTTTTSESSVHQSYR